MTWKIVTLGEVLTESGILAEASSPDRRITVRLNVKGVEKRPVGNDKEGATKYFVRKTGQFIYGRQNLHKGAFGIIPTELNGYESSQDLPAFDIAEQCEPAWLIYFLRQGNFYESLDRIARGIGSRRINPKDLYEIEMPLPPLDEQRILLQTLAATDEAATALAQDFAHQATLLTRLRQAVLREAVQGRLVPQDATDEPAPALIARIRAEKQRLVKEKKLRADKPLPPLSEKEVPYEVPQGWAWCRLGSISNVVRGGSPRPAGDNKYYNGNIPFLKVADLTAEEDVYLFNHTYTIKEAGLNKTRLVEANTLMLTNSGATLGIPKICTFATTFNDGVAAFLNIYEAADKVYLYYFLKYKSAWFLEEASRGQGQPNLNTDIIAKVPVPLPPLPEQRRIVAKVTELLAHCTELEAELRRARQAAEALHAAALREAFQGAPVAVSV